MHTKPDKMTHLQKFLMNEMVAAQLQQTEYCDQHRKTDPNLHSGEMVWFLQ